MMSDAMTDTLLTTVEMTDNLNALFWLYLELSMRIWLGSTYTTSFCLR